jgi:Protein of unknown function (DUF1003)
VGVSRWLRPRLAGTREAVDFRADYDMPNTQHPHAHIEAEATLGISCAACALLDGVDGTIDGSFGPVGAVAKSEHGFRAMVKRAENRSADRITGFAGSMKFVYIHIGWFVVWVSLNVGLAGIGWEFDKFPFGLLTMIVSLEAIFLATFVMISQNRSSARADLRSELDFENNVRAEVWSIHIGHSLGIDSDHVESIVQKALATSRAHMSGS